MNNNTGVFTRINSEPFTVNMFVVTMSVSAVVIKVEASSLNCYYCYYSI